MPTIGLKEILLLAGLVVLLFGAKRIPDIAKGLGSAIRNFKGSLRAGAQGEDEAQRLDDGPAALGTGERGDRREDGGGA